MMGKWSIPDCRGLREKKGTNPIRDSPHVGGCGIVLVSRETVSRTDGSESSDTAKGGMRGDIAVESNNTLSDPRFVQSE